MEDDEKMKRTKSGKLWTVVCALLAFVLVFSLAACGGGGKDNNDVALTLDKKTVSVEENKTATVSVTSATKETVTWTISPAGFATIVPSGAGNKLVTITGVAEGTATLTAKAGSKTATCSVTVTPAQGGEGGGEGGGDEPGDRTPVNVAFGGENEFESGWRYWTGTSDNINAQVSSCINYTDNNETVIKYTWSTGLWFGTQLFYKDKNTGTVHDVSLTIVSPVAANITVNGEKQELIAGENTVTVDGFAGATLSVQFGVDGESCVFGTDLEFTFKNIEITPHAEVELKAPSFAFDSDTKVITITDSQNDAANVEKYVLGVFVNATDEIPAKTLDVTSGNAVDFASVTSGNYILKVRAVNSSTAVINSGWSTVTVNFEWSNDKTPLQFSAKSDIAAGSNTWYYWAQTWDPIASITECYIQDDSVYFVGISNNVGNHWGVQLLYKGEAGKKLTMNVTSVNGGTITVNGVEYVLEANVAKGITVNNITELEIDFGANVTGGEDKSNNIQGDITFSDITITNA